MKTQITYRFTHAELKGLLEEQAKKYSDTLRDATLHIKLLSRPRKAPVTAASLDEEQEAIEEAKVFLEVHSGYDEDYLENVEKPRLIKMLRIVLRTAAQNEEAFHRRAIYLAEDDYELNANELNIAGIYG